MNPVPPVTNAFISAPYPCFVDYSGRIVSGTKLI
jgi:hypothetical protein